MYVQLMVFPGGDGKLGTYAHVLVASNLIYLLLFLFFPFNLLGRASSTQMFSVQVQIKD